MNNDNMDHKFLQDVSATGRKRFWRLKKKQSIMLSESLHRLGQNKKGNRVWWCAHELEFVVSEITGRKKLIRAGFCRERLCVMCQWRRSMKVFHQVSKVIDRCLAKDNTIQPIFLTLTVKNCDGDQLREVLDQIFGGWNALTKHRKIRRIQKGWFRALEVTYNQKDGSYHPHFHAILLMDKPYFVGHDYMQTADWVQMWRTSCKLDYDPICDIRRVKPKRGAKHKAVAEVAKYTIKGSQYLYAQDDALTDQLVDVIGKSIKGRRLYAFGGMMHKVAKELKIEAAEGDLVNIDEDAIRSDLAEMIQVYKWSFGVENYVRER